MNSFINFNDPASVAKVVGLLIPILVAIVTKKVASGGLKGVINLVLSALGGSLAYLVAKNGGYDFNGFLNATINTFVVSIAAYYGVYKPTGMTNSVADATAGVGIGKPELQTDATTVAVEVPPAVAADVQASVADEPVVEPVEAAAVPAKKAATPRKRAPRKKVAPPSDPTEVAKLPSNVPGLRGTQRSSED